MALDQQLSSFMPHTVTIAPYSSKNNYGENTTGAVRTARAYVEPNKTLTSDNDSETEHRPTTAYIADTSITVRDVITLPDGSTPSINSIEIHTEVAGLEHTVVRFA